MSRLNFRLLASTALAFGGLVAAGTAPALAGTESIEYRLNSLENRVQGLERDNAAKDERIRELEARPAGMGGFAGDKFQLDSEDGAYSFRLGGRIFLDGAYFDDDLQPIGTDFEARSLRLFSSGHIYNDWKYKIQVDFAGNDVSVKDAYIANGGLKIGQFKQPLSLEELTSSKFITFMERAMAVEAFAVGRQLGVGYTMGGDNYSASAGLFTPTRDLEAEGGGDSNDDAGYGIAGRVTFAPINEEQNGQPWVVHLGVGGAYTEYSEDHSIGDFYEWHPGSHLAPTMIAAPPPGGKRGAEVVTINPEAAMVWGPFSLQGEYFHVEHESVFGQESTFDGWYAQGSFFVTGDVTRNYSASSGVFGRTKATNALELAIRYDTIDTSEATDAGGVGTEADNITVGANYYFNPAVRVMFNWVNSDIDGLLGGVGFEQEINIFQTRLHLDF